MPARISNLSCWTIGLIALLLVRLTSYADLWRTGYYPGWEQSAMPASALDFTTLTHVIHFSLVPAAGGALDAGANSITTSNSSDLVTNAHAAGRKVLICVGGAGTETLFQAATTPAVLPVFIRNLTNFMTVRGYDGIDVDWEPLPSTDAGQYTNLISGLRSALAGFSQPKLLTVAVGAYPPYGDSATADYLMFAALQSRLDQINIMLYDMAGPYEGWVTWFNAPIYDGGYRFPSTGGLLPSVNGSVQNFLTNGVAPGKLGIGIPFYGYLWTGGRGTAPSGITQPRQSWTVAPTATGVRYSDIMAHYFQTNLYHWDASAQSAFLGITNANPTNSIFISYDDTRACQAKISYARNLGLGGVMIWELAQDHPSAGPDPLMQAIHQALNTPGQAAIQTSGNDAGVTFSAIPLGSYRIQWSDDLRGVVWNTLAITNTPDAGGPLRINDTGALGSHSQRFYRIKTPP